MNPDDPTVILPRRSERDGVREARTVPAHDTALFRGALLEITKLGARITELETENERLRAVITTIARADA